MSILGYNQVLNGVPVKKEYLLDYGRVDLDFYKINDETFYMDFSV